MPNVIINEKDLSVFNIYLDNDNIVWIPGFSITGPYEAPRLLNSHSDLVAIYGDRPPAETYASIATSDTYKLCSGWDFAAQMLRHGFRVLFQRIVPYTYENGSLTFDIDTKYLRNASIDLVENETETTETVTYDLSQDSVVDPEKTYYTQELDPETHEPTGEYEEVAEPTGNPSENDPPYYEKHTTSTSTTTPKYKIGFREKSGGTFGDRLDIIFTVNQNNNKLYYKLVDTLTAEVVEYVEICEITYNEATGVAIDYLLSFARGFCAAVGASSYIELVTDSGYLSTITALNNYILETIKSDVESEVKEEVFHIDQETGLIVYTGTGNIIFDETNPNYLIDGLMVNPKVGESGTGTLTKTVVRSNIILGKSKLTSGDGNTIILPADAELNLNTEVTATTGKDYTENDAYDTSASRPALTILADTIQRSLKNIEDKILFDVKYITLGNIYSTDSLYTTNGMSVYNVVADICALRGDCVGILNPSYRRPSTSVKGDFSALDGKPSSYVAVFAPWCVMGIYNSTQQWCSPAMVFLTALADSVANGNPVYLPPAGVNRATIPDIVKTEYMIGSSLLDKWQNKDLPTNINPIMYLNTYGYVIFGQRTLYDVSDELVGTRSALQELGVRLTVLECKKEIRKVAIGLLFEYNNIHTWNEFKEGLRPLFSEMLNNGALTQYQIVMDDTTNDADDIDSNTLRGIVRIIPGRAVEDVIISFELYRNGVTFTNQEPNS